MRGGVACRSGMHAAGAASAFVSHHIMTIACGISIIAHRGLWTRPAERNSPAALDAALASGFGIETDVRDHAGCLVVSHDMPSGHEQPFADLLARYVHRGQPGPLALNIKADGLADAVHDACATRNVTAYFCFDMSVPDGRSYLARAMPLYGRRSELEPASPFLDRCDGIWLDAFMNDWFTVDDILAWTTAGKQVCIVSPELHGRPHQDVWSLLQTLSRAHAPDVCGRLAVCTDYPLQLQDALS